MFFIPLRLDSKSLTVVCVSDINCSKKAGGMGGLGGLGRGNTINYNRKSFPFFALQPLLVQFGEKRNYNGTGGAAQPGTKHLQPINQINRFNAECLPTPALHVVFPSSSRQLKFFKGHPQLQLWFEQYESTGQRQKVIEAVARVLIPAVATGAAGCGPFWRLAQIYITTIIYGVGPGRGSSRAAAGTASGLVQTSRPPPTRLTCLIWIGRKMGKIACVWTWICGWFLLGVGWLYNQKGHQHTCSTFSINGTSVELNILNNRLTLERH